MPIVTSLCLAAALAAPVAQADPMFDQAVLHETRIVMDPGDWQALRDDFRSNQFYAANLSIDGEVVLQVGIRSRGDGSRSGEKPGLKIDFNKYVKTQEFHGYKTLVLDNLVQDVAMMRERLAFAVFEAVGIPAPQIAHTRLTVNDEYWGLYTLVEAVSKPFLEARIGEKSGNLFDYEYAFPWDFSFRGDDASAYVPVPLQPQTNEDSLDPAGLIDFFRRINGATEASFVAEVTALLDVPRFLAYLAVENALAETDGIAGAEGANNFYLYQYGGQDRFVFIPWDKETCLASSSWPLFQRMDGNVLTRRLIADPGLRTLYVDAVERAAAFVNARFLLPKLEQTYAQVREAALTDARKPYTNDEFELGIHGLRGVIAAREEDVLAQVRAAR